MIIKTTYIDVRIINIIYFLSFNKERMGKNNGKSFWKDF